MIASNGTDPNTLSEYEQLLYVSQSPFNIKHIENPSELVQLKAIERNALSVQYIADPKMTVECAAVQQDVRSIEYLKNLRSIRDYYGLHKNLKHHAFSCPLFHTELFDLFDFFINAFESNPRIIGKWIRYSDTLNKYYKLYLDKYTPDQSDWLIKYLWEKVFISSGEVDPLIKSKDINSITKLVNDSPSTGVCSLESIRRLTQDLYDPIVIELLKDYSLENVKNFKRLIWLLNSCFLLVEGAWLTRNLIRDVVIEYINRGITGPFESIFQVSANPGPMKLFQEIYESLNTDQKTRVATFYTKYRKTENRVIFENFLMVMGLNVGDYPLIRIQQKNIPTSIKILLDNFNENKERELDANNRSSWIDILGHYDANSRKIVIYRKAIEIFADYLGVNALQLEKLVIAHELSHAATHLGMDENGNIWDSFNDAPPEQKEYYAQWYAHRYGAIYNYAKHAELMRKLVKFQPEMYGAYLNDFNENREAINSKLLKDRSVLNTVNL